MESRGSWECSTEDKKPKEGNLFNTRSAEMARLEEKALNELDEWLAMNELIWRQRSRTDWLKDGERNIAFFKAKSSRMKERKYIEMILKMMGVKSMIPQKFCNSLWVSLTTFFPLLKSPCRLEYNFSNSLA